MGKYTIPLGASTIMEKTQSISIQENDIRKEITNISTPRWQTIICWVIGLTFAGYAAGMFVTEYIKKIKSCGHQKLNTTVNIKNPWST
ncbi:MAG: fatty acid desaturase [Paraglaciecola sp.]